jgi:imidazolonepropionase-like amidohydrolase
VISLWLTACAASPAVVVDHVRLFDGTTVVEDARVVFDDGVITSVGGGEIPAGAQVIDGRGKTLLPGLIDAHTHAWSDEDLGQALAFGVTTELDMMDNPKLEGSFKRRAATDHRIADVRFAGYGATAPGGHGTQFVPGTPTLGKGDDAAAFVRTRVSEGSDYIKVVLEDGGGTIPSLTATQAGQVVDAAHALDRIAVVHISTRVRASDAVTAGADGLVHVWTDGPDANLVRRLHDADMFVVPTLTVTGCPTGTFLAHDPRVTPFLRPRDGASLQAMAGETSHCDGMLVTVRELHDGGVAVLAGTDANNAGAVHGAGLHGELASLVRAGFTPVGALAAATSVPASRFRLEDRGRVAPGLRADLVLVDGDPTKDITRTLDIVSVWKQGEKFDRAAWQAGLGATTSLPGSVSGEFNEGGTGLPRGEWQVASDRNFGGSSSVEITTTSGGANGTARALDVRGEVKPHTATFAGTVLRTGSGRTGTTDLTGLREVVFWVRGDASSTYVRLLTAGSAGPPAVVRFQMSPSWTPVHIALDDFRSPRSAVLGLFFGTDKIGPFHFQVDQVELR